MMELAAHQARWMAALRGEPVQLDGWLRGPQPQHRLDLYRRSRQARLLGCLENEFPRVKALLGRVHFHAAACEYLQNHPPADPSLGQLGRIFPEHLLRCATNCADPNQAQVLRLAAELARLEWMWSEVFVAPDDPPVDTSALRSVPASVWPSLQFRLVHCHRSARFEFDVASFELARPHIVPSEGAVQILLWRRDFRVFVRRIDDVEADLLEAMGGGATLEAACEHVAGSVETAASRLLELVMGWFQDGLVAQVHRSRLETEPDD
jgi:hypothetical protein